MTALRVAATAFAIASSSPGLGAPVSKASTTSAAHEISPAVVENIRVCAARLAATDRFSGVLLIEHDGKAVLEFSRAATGSGPFSMDTPFNIASAVKMFTAVAIGQLVEQGKVRFDGRLGDYLSELPGNLARVSVEQALTHTGGIGGLTRLTPDVAARIRGAKNARALVPLIAEGGLSFEPGSRTEYSNGGFILLGAVVEAASGMHFRDYVASNILAKAGMTSTSADEPPNAAVRLSTIAPGARPGGRALTRMSSGGTPAGGWYSSARDLARFARALREHRLISRPTLESMVTIRSRPASGARALQAAEQRGYGYGFGVTEAPTSKIVGHNGGAPGSNAEVAISIGNGWAIIALSNIDPPAATNLMTFAQQTLRSGRGTLAECEQVASVPGPFGR